MKRGYYRGIPVYVNVENSYSAEVKGRNWFYSRLVDIMVWLDVNIFLVDGFDIFIEE